MEASDGDGEIYYTGESVERLYHDGSGVIMTLCELDEHLVRRYSNLWSGDPYRNASVMVEDSIGRCVHVQRIEADCGCWGNAEAHGRGLGPTGDLYCCWTEAWISYL